MTAEILRAAERLSAPWKNGGGVTREIAVFPHGADLARFDWRMSLATVAAGGPFSTFPGIDRLMLVLDGRLDLEIAGADRRLLDATSAAAEFPGDADVRALAPATPVTDVNLMVRRGHFTASLERRTIAGAATVVCQGVTLILCLTPVEAAIGPDRFALAPGDVLRVEGTRGALARFTRGGDFAIAHVNAVR